MQILFLTTAHNSLSQRLQVELTDRGHAVGVVIAGDEAALSAALERSRPDVIIAPMLKTAIAEAIWREHVCLIVHPGIVGDRGPSSLDWAITHGQTPWGVTVLQATAEMDAGPVWASCEFEPPARPIAKSSLYRHEVTEAAVRAVLTALDHLQQRKAPPPEPSVRRGTLRPAIKQADRALDWHRHGSAEIVRRIRAADSSPGLLESRFGAPVFLYGAHEEDRLEGEPGALLARRHGAVCVGTIDGAVWITHSKARHPGAIKLPAVQVLGQAALDLPEVGIDPFAEACHRTWRDIHYDERGQVGYLSFDFCNGAMSTEQCRRLRDAFLRARARATKVLVLMGGRDFFSNGIDLNAIEAAPDPAVESWHNIHAIDDLVVEILNTAGQITVAALRGNAGAGGAMLALAADHVHARAGVVLNPHYRSMGGLYGSEYWTYTLPRRVGATRALQLTEDCRPLGTGEARLIGLIDEAYGTTAAGFDRELERRCEAIAADPDHWNALRRKHERRLADERGKPLAAYRQEELARMRVDFFGPDSGYHDARRRFVHKVRPGQAIPESAPGLQRAAPEFAVGPVLNPGGISVRSRPLPRTSATGRP